MLASAHILPGQARAVISSGMTRDAYYAEIVKLRTENEELREELRQAKELTKPPRLGFPNEWELTVCEAKALSLLYLSKHGACYGALLEASAASNVDSVALDYTKVHICRIRRKTKSFGIVIETIWGEGYRLTPESKEIIARALA